MELPPDKLQSTLRDHHFDIKAVKDEDKAQLSLNVAPQTHSMVYCVNEGEHELLAMKWTLQPSFAKEPVKFSTFNTRSESLDPLRPVWRSARTRRGILFMQGYYEWEHDKATKERKPHYIFSPKEPVLCCFVIWDVNKTLSDVPTFSIVTTSAASNLAAVHPRMPVIAPDFDAARRWVDGQWPDVLSLLAANTHLDEYRVAKDVNKVGTHKPGLNKPLNETKVTSWFAPQKRERKDLGSEDGPRHLKTEDAEAAPQKRERKDLGSEDGPRHLKTEDTEAAPQKKKAKKP